MEPSSRSAKASHKAEAEPGKGNHSEIRALKIRKDPRAGKGERKKSDEIEGE
jgi:hypothetical protein